MVDKKNINIDTVKQYLLDKFPDSICENDKIDITIRGIVNNFIITNFDINNDGSINETLIKYNHYIIYERKRKIKKILEDE